MFPTSGFIPRPQNYIISQVQENQKSGNGTTFLGSLKKAQSAKKGTRIEANGAVNCTLQ